MKHYILYLQKEKDINIKRAVEIIAALTLVTCNVNHSKVIFEMSLIFGDEILYNSENENEFNIISEILEPFNLKLLKKEYEG